MGYNFTAIFENKQEFKEFVKMPNVIKNSKLFSNLRELTDNQDWKWLYEKTELKNEMDVFGYVTLTGPCDIDITFGYQLIEVTHNTRWKEFVEIESIRLWIRKICFDLSKMFGFPVYTSEFTQSTDFVTGGNGFTDLLNHLIREYGEIETNIGVETYRYVYMDRFEDLKSTNWYHRQP
ncbi:hypothetical protein [Paenibacillus chitinolyticus]|uniref:hypothetical protein n=1 Tax=Paenibacillus chitinolyticus TaxID=79263 RepID=UPI001C4859E2|nr:hypothetical protein [Paenibacillus chitinolyticus]MBV6714151.1 hypothetical protein [Paenibacillus chitinolyticus]